MGVSGDFGKLEQLARDIAQLGEKGRKLVSEACAEEAHSLIKDGFEKSQAPDGSAWAPLAVRDGQPLRDTGRLEGSLVPRVTSDGFTVGTNVEYGEVQQKGGTVHAKKARQLYSAKLGKGFGKTVVIPARPFLPMEGELPAAWLERLTEAAQDVVALLMKKAGK